MNGKRKGALIIVAFLPIIIMAIIVFFTGGFSSSNYLPEVDNGYEITEYNVDVVVNEDGTYDIIEEITADFLASSHGILRWFPTRQNVKYYNREGELVSKGRKAKITNFFTYVGTPSVDHTSNENGYVVYYFGDSLLYVTGEQKYKFKYTLDPGDDRDKTMDMFYFNIIGNGWNTSISNISFQITFPTDIEGNVDFYVGKYGESNTNSPRVTSVISGNQITGTCASLDYGEAITAFKSFDNGYFDYSSQRHIAFDIAFVVAFVVLAGIMAIYIIVKGQKTPVVNVVEFKAPDGLTPTEAGYLNDGKITGDDLSALIVYWASKEIVRIVEKEKNITVVKLKDLPESSKKHEKLLFDALFKNKESFSPSNVSSSEIGEAGYNCKTSVEKLHADKFETKNLNGCATLLGAVWFFIAALFFKNIVQTYTSFGVTFVEILLVIITSSAILAFNSIYENKHKFRRKKYLFCIVVDLICVFAPLIAFVFAFDHYYDLLYMRFFFIILPVLFVIFLIKLERYTEEGKKLLGQIRGLKAYIETAEKDKLEMLVKDNPSIFYEILPYAYVLGVSEVYMNKFKDIPIINPDYYRTDDGSFGYVHFVILNNNLNSFSKTSQISMIQNSPAAKALSSSGGRGGFSGGGSGGGGGGRW